MRDWKIEFEAVAFLAIICLLGFAVTGYWRYAERHQLESVGELQEECSRKNELINFCVASMTQLRKENEQLSAEVSDLRKDVERYREQTEKYRTDIADAIRNYYDQ